MTGTAGLDLAQLHAHLAARGVEPSGTLRADLIAGGRSNLTYAVTDGTSRWVVRRPPRAGVTASAHDMAREFRVTSALHSTAVPVARSISLCEDESVLGAPFTVVEWVDGVVIRDREDLTTLSDDEVQRTTAALVEVLVNLHAVDVAAVGLEDFGRPAGFLARQVALWRRQWDRTRTRDFPDLERLHARLADSVPATSEATVVHGDYRIDNVILDRNDTGTVRAVVDWELSTLGDPLTDVALMCVYRHPALDAILGIPAAWTSPRLPSPDALAESYARGSGRDLGNRPFYLALAHLKLAVIAEGIAHRAHAGADAGRDARGAAEAVPELVAAGLRALGTRRSIQRSVPAPEVPDRFADDPAFAVHEGGKLSVRGTRPITSIADLALTYTPGVARVSSAIAAEPELARRFTWAPRVVAVVSDGTAVLGLGDIGPSASLPVMEGKACLFNEFAGLNAVPIVLDTKDPDLIVEVVAALAPSFGGINLEDISAPRCFEIEARLRERLDIPVMHDDQHGTAIVVLAALRNAARVTGRTLADLRVVVAGAGAAGIACTKILLEAGVGDISVADSRGVLHTGREDLTEMKRWAAESTNTSRLAGTMVGALAGADVYIGLSGGTVPESAIASMAEGCIVFSLANPIPEVDPEMAARYAAVVATGRSDLPNQINNVLAFPGVFRGAIDAGAASITEEMKLAAATAIADVVGDDLRPDYVVPSPLDRRVATAVAEAVAACSREQAVTP